MNIYSIDRLPQGYYVYAYLRNDLTPYYIGKGKGKRAWNYHSKFVKVPEQQYISVIQDTLTEQEAYQLEKDLIKQYGRKQIDENGILINRTDGGQGGAGAPKGRTAPNKGMPAWNKGLSATDETRQKISQKLKGRETWNKGISTPDDVKIKQSIALKGISKDQITCPRCGKSGGKPVMIRHHFDNCNSVDR